MTARQARDRGPADSGEQRARRDRLTGRWPGLLECGVAGDQAQVTVHAGGSRTVITRPLWAEALDLAEGLLGGCGRGNGSRPP